MPATTRNMSATTRLTAMAAAYARQPMTLSSARRTVVRPPKKNIGRGNRKTKPGRTATRDSRPSSPDRKTGMLIYYESSFDNMY